MLGNNRLRAGCFFLIVTAACTARHPATAPTGTRAADRVSLLTAAVTSSRARLDSALLEIHRTSGETSAPAVARSRELRKRVTSLDSTYRADLAELLWTVNASTAGEAAGN